MSKEDVSMMPRREFLGGMAATAAALGIGGFEASELVGNAHAADPRAMTQFQSWLENIPGRYRQVYDAPSANNGFALIWSHIFLLTGAQGYNVAESELGVVVVLRHSAIPIAFRDEAWEKYRLGEYFKINDPSTKAAALRNPFAHIRPGDMPVPEAALEKLVERGVRVAVCNAAIHFQSMRMAKQLGVEHDEVKQDWIRAVWPGVEIVPSGVLAINGAQSKGCSYCFAG